MKIRSDFVTNSSSSSFVIAYKEQPNYSEEEIRKYPSLKVEAKLFKLLFELESSWGDTNCADIYRNKEEFDEYFKDRFCWSNHPIEETLKGDVHAKGFYNKAISYIQKGYSIADKSVDHNDEGIAELIEALSEEDSNFVLIERCD